MRAAACEHTSTSAWSGPLRSMEACRSGHSRPAICEENASASKRAQLWRTLPHDAQLLKYVAVTKCPKNGAIVCFGACGCVAPPKVVKPRRAVGRVIKLAQDAAHVVVIAPATSRRGRAAREHVRCGHSAAQHQRKGERNPGRQRRGWNQTARTDDRGRALHRATGTRAVSPRPSEGASSGQSAATCGRVPRSECAAGGQAWALRDSERRSERTARGCASASATCGSAHGEPASGAAVGQGHRKNAPTPSGPTRHRGLGAGRLGARNKGKEARGGCTAVPDDGEVWRERKSQGVNRVRHPCGSA